MADEKSPSTSQTKFTVELGPMDLTAEEVSSISNNIAKEIVDKVHKNRAVSKREISGEPYAQFTFGKLLHERGAHYDRTIR